MLDTIDQQRWWVQRWLELLDSYRFKKRLERARNYAKAGHVLQIDFIEAQAIALVQGTEPEPYRVSLNLEPFSDEAWGYVVESLAQKAIFSAQLLAGEMPAAIEQVFTENGLNLFPFTLTDIHSHCTCPDKANPCKHIGAVYYQLGDRFNEDPFVIFQLRGRTKTQILEALQDYRRQHCDAETATRPNVDLSTGPEAPTSSKKTIDLEQFWHYDQPLDPDLVVLTPPTDGKTSLDLLGAIALNPEDAQAFQNYLNYVYGNASQQGLMQALQGLNGT
ncbi:SWIM zinc finger domain protein [[Synechococcus] sp. NIES-970]|nr:SWIM zinc finger domain protein [[Synechococcus] sp. NIES-970]